jgi:hypothetical protein
MYNDVPAIELGAEDYSTENYPPYAPSAELSQYWRSIDPSLNIRRSFDASQTDTSAHLVNMEKRLLNLTNSAYGCGRFPALEVSQEDSPRLALTTIWGPGSEALRSIRYMSPNAPWGSSLSSTNSTPSDQAFSPDVSRHRASLFRDDFDSQASFGSPYTMSYSQSQYSYTSYGSHSGHTVASPAPIDQAVACTMKELQYNPDLEAEEILEESDCIKIESVGPVKMAPTPESCYHAIDTLSRSEYDDSMQDEDEKSIGSDIDPDYCPSRSQPARRTSSSIKHPRSPTLTRGFVAKSTLEHNRILKASQRQSTSTKNKTKTVSRRRPSTKNGDSRPFICAFSHYGCDSRFSSKNEWKRHVSSQHLQLGFYRCDSEPCNPEIDHNRARLAAGNNRTYNDFNRKDLFTQHHRRMHTPWTPASKPPSKKANEDFEEALEEVRQRCWTERRQAPRRSRCIFCDRRFEGETAWEERMEHIGKHFEKAEREKKDLGIGEEDPDLKLWALHEGIVVDCGNKGCWLDGMQATRDVVRSPAMARTRKGKVMEVGEADEDAIGDDE